MIYGLMMTAKAWALFYVGTWLFAKLVGRADAEWVKGKPLGIMMGFYAVGMLGHSYWLAYVVMIATLPMLTKSRGEAAALFVVASGSIVELSNPVTVGGTYLLFLDKWICLSIGFVLVMVLKPRVGPRAARRFDLPFLIMLALELTQARNLNVTATFRVALGVLLSEGLPYLALVLSINRVRDMRRLMLALVYLGFMLALVAMVEATTKQFLYQQMDGQLGSSGRELYQMNKIRGGILRAPTSFPDATNFAQFLVISLMAALAYRPFFRSTRMLGVVLGAISIGIFITSTRNAWIGLLISVLAFDLYRKRYVALTGKGIVLGIIYGTMMLLAEFVPYFATMTGNSADTASTSEYRSLLLTRGTEEFHKHPYVGTDIGTIMINMRDLTQGEGIIDFVNGYLFYALMGGIGGLVGLGLVFLLPCGAMLGIRRAMTRRQLFLERVAAFTFSIGLNYFICTAFTGFGGHGSMFFYEVLAIGAVLFSWRRIAPEKLADWDRSGEPAPHPPPTSKPMPLLQPAFPD